jgi:hypothetical protein
MEHAPMLDFNRANVSVSALSVAINELMERAEPPEENVRQYLGASSVGNECLRRVQYDWLVDPQHPTRMRDIFARGHFFEEVSRQHLKRCGFRFAPGELRFVAAGGLFRGHVLACGNTSASVPRDGARSSATASRRHTRNTQPRPGCIKPISRSPNTRRYSLPPMPTPASGCTLWSRSMLSRRRLGRTAP